ncbi:Hypothetical predicted protein [Marmota monax]|uniref:Uncharacterized protein n=1 Tax=Marmota monax TaxID=9995 RepID=A0A5E4A2P7_MARMO|nr:hypothetical protein GHT09_000881 [Marmota monax]VTJ51398.1 Hypothetical predicted protein [Marmota monax]
MGPWGRKSQKCTFPWLEDPKLWFSEECRLWAVLPAGTGQGKPKWGGQGEVNKTGFLQAPTWAWHCSGHVEGSRRRKRGQDAYRLGDLSLKLALGEHCNPSIYGSSLWKCQRIPEVLRATNKGPRPYPPFRTQQKMKKRCTPVISADEEGGSQV